MRSGSRAASWSPLRVVKSRLPRCYPPCSPTGTHRTPPDITNSPRRGSSPSSGWAGNPAELREPPLEQAPLGVVMDQRQRSTVRITGLFRSAESPQQLGPRRVQVAVVVEVEAIDDDEPRLRTLGLGDRHGPVQLHDGGAGEAGKLAVEGAIWGQSCGSSACRDAIAACTT